MTTITETYTEIGTEIATAIDTCMEANADAGTATAADGVVDTAEDWLTRPRIGQLAGKNEQTIDRDIKRHGFESRSPGYYGRREPVFRCRVSHCSVVG